VEPALDVVAGERRYQVARGYVGLKDGAGENRHAMARPGGRGRQRRVAEDLATPRIQPADARGLEPPVPQGGRRQRVQHLTRPEPLEVLWARQVVRVAVSRAAYAHQVTGHDELSRVIRVAERIAVVLVLEAVVNVPGVVAAYLDVDVRLREVRA